MRMAAAWLLLLLEIYLQSGQDFSLIKTFGNLPQMIFAWTFIG